ncbi:hypothetical protein O6H91_04G070300 [Diphasiastrum complanatum]|uniref:Uncharacterized protein n=1 Tax=Diphasiastrum complanatum TaxID=34168 RepID=A0ACC2DXR6_DIPCM|nr:hypothetical protein O6H91_04G070300 [Diphasiastrum complanatum]
MGKAAAEGSLEVSPTWAVAVVCSIFVILSLALERALHYAGKWLKRHDQKSLYQALEKIKEELMLLGFLSLLLTVFQPVVAGICMPHSFVDHMLPCKLNKTEYFQSISEGVVSSPVESGHGRKLLTHSILYERQASLRRLLSSNGSNSKCSARSKVPYLSIEALHQLHIFIFVLAIVHVFYSFLTMVLSRIKIHTWHKWEKEAHIVHFDCVKAVMSIRPSFVAKHLNRPWSSSILLSWMVSFLRQFVNSVNRTDYLTLRVGFINTHKTGSKFDFHNYVNRVMQDDFKRLVGISGYLWAFVVIFLLLNVQGWHTYFWIAFLPIIMIVIIGTKLQHIITTLAYGIADAQSCNGPDAVIQPRDELFWFHRPKLVLHLLHFTLFQNAFELAFFFWIWATFGFDSCFMDNRAFVIVRLVIGVVVQVVCSYSTLPLWVRTTKQLSSKKISRTH